jgi:hypothetical protein
MVFFTLSHEGGGGESGKDSFSMHFCYKESEKVCKKKKKMSIFSLFIIVWHASKYV